ncbi:NEQ325 [Nanoarchaeum equitans Kin4-M]|uniref:tRNA(Phe) 7-((3-amino-3-carboxypropyl)-4-demethylwyosine(37)-N(4))-methyltransferase n=1 Tax=Nanoarchaeum equitans (strain Kin4-M) TaxID=228908 RepID=Q74M97_NANEQ|nr:NEQ325 [Nanoarchaeum equitans Kin4-M]
MFDELKKQFLERLEREKQLGYVDKPIIPLLDLINSFDNYFTLSSCSGRISLFVEGGKKYNSYPLFKSHYPVKAEELYEYYINYKGEKPLIFKFEPFIIHIQARTLYDGLKLLSIAQKLGLKYSALFNIKLSDQIYYDKYEVNNKKYGFERVILYIMGHDRIETIVYKNKHLVSEEYIKVLVEEANRKLLKNWALIESLYNEIKNLKENQ